MNATTQALPDYEAVNLSRESATELTKLLKERPEADRASVKIDGHDLILPRQAIVLLRDILAEMSQGNAVTIIPRGAEVTTQQAADFLNVSRPYLVKLLENDELKYCKVGTHRRIKFEDLVEYKNRTKGESASAIDELVRMAQENDMGY